MGNTEGKELSCTTHGCELRGGILWEGGAGQREIKGGNVTTVIKYTLKINR